jgi:hypothetical protein
MGMPEIAEALKRAAKHQEEVRRKDFERLERQKVDAVINFASAVFDKAAAYENIIIAAGYVAFFSVWAATAEHLTRTAVLWSGGLISISLIAYVMWHVLQMSVRLKTQPAFGKIVQDNPAPDEFLRRWQEVETQQNKDSIIMLRVWPYFFLTSLVTGLAGGVLLAYNSLAVVTGLPVLL